MEFDASSVATAQNDDISWTAIALGTLSLLFLVRIAVWAVNYFLVAPARDPLRTLGGPSASPMQSHLDDTLDPDCSPETHTSWVEKFGKTFRIHGFGRHDLRLITYDPQAVKHILGSSVFEKPWQTRVLMENILGRGIVNMEGEEHKAQRKLVGPALNSAAIKQLAPSLMQKAKELLDVLEHQLDESRPISSPKLVVTPPSPASSSSDLPSELDESPYIGDTRVPGAPHSPFDVLEPICRAIFDGIGLALFDTQFNAISEDPSKTSPMYDAFRSVLTWQENMTASDVLSQLYYPWINRVWPTANIKRARESVHVITETSRKIFARKREEMIAGYGISSPKQQDILSLLIKANMSSDPTTRLSDATLLDQIRTFLFAGSDSTALLVTWTLYFLSRHSDVQERLRAELFAYRAQRPLTPPLDSEPEDSEGSRAIEELDKLPYLSAILKESLRRSPPIHSTIRVPTENTIIPLSEPVRSRDGRMLNEVEIRRGSFIHIPLEGLNMAESEWGPDSKEFNPERWLDTSNPAPRLHSFSHGPHSCPGSRVAQLAAKVFLATLLPVLSFSPPADCIGRDEEGNDNDKVRKWNVFVTRPTITKRFDDGPQMQLVVSRVGEDGN